MRGLPEAGDQACHPEFTRRLQFLIGHENGREQRLRQVRAGNCRQRDVDKVPPKELRTGELGEFTIAAKLGWAVDGQALAAALRFILDQFSGWVAQASFCAPRGI